jgi:hypothetical protein
MLPLVLNTPLLRPQHLEIKNTTRTDYDKLNSNRTSLPAKEKSNLTTPKQIKTFLDRKKEEESVLESY